jgi:hypothetical protein
MAMVRGLLAGALLAWGAAATAADDAEVYSGGPLPEGSGVVVIRVERVASSEGVAVLERRLDAPSVLLREVDGKRSLMLRDCDTALAIVLPAGRWYVEELRTPRERSLPRVMQKHQSFEVKAGSINYAGYYHVRFLMQQGGRLGSSVAIEYDPPLIEEATAAFPRAFETLPLLYCPVGRTCKPPSEFRF